jgi:hypothetical protein
MDEAGDWSLAMQALAQRLWAGPLGAPGLLSRSVGIQFKVRVLRGDIHVMLLSDLWLVVCATVAA